MKHYITLAAYSFGGLPIVVYAKEYIWAWLIGGLVLLFAMGVRESLKK